MVLFTAKASLIALKRQALHSIDSDSSLRATPEETPTDPFIDDLSVILVDESLHQIQDQTLVEVWPK